MVFLIFSHINLQLAEKELICRVYNAAKVLSTTEKVEIISKKKFAAALLNEKDKIFVLHMAATNIRATLNIHFFLQAQIGLLEVERITILSEYTDYTNVFLLDSAAELPKHTGIHYYPIELINDKQPLNSLIYSLGSIEL